MAKAGHRRWPASRQGQGGAGGLRRVRCPLISVAEANARVQLGCRASSSFHSAGGLLGALGGEDVVGLGGAVVVGGVVRLLVVRAVRVAVLDVVALVEAGVLGRGVVLLVDAELRLVVLLAAATWCSWSSDSCS